MANIPFETVNTAATKKKHGNTLQIILLFLVCCAIFAVIAFALRAKKNQAAEKEKAAQTQPTTPAPVTTEPAQAPAAKETAPPPVKTEQAAPSQEAEASVEPAPEERNESKGSIKPDMTRPLPELDEKLGAKVAAMVESTDAANIIKVRDQLEAKLKKYPENSPQWRSVATAIGMLNIKVFNGFGLLPDKVVFHQVVPGDSLSKLAKKYHTSVEAIQHANRIPANSSIIRLGQKLRIYNGDWTIRVGKKAHLLYVYDGGKLFKIYDIGIGKQGRTPVGLFRVTDKIKNPDWYSPDGRVIKFGEKENVLGTRWFKIEPEGSTDHRLAGYGIHGTSDDTSITRSQSNGCVRMRNPDVEELYMIIPRQVKVSIGN